MKLKDIVYYVNDREIIKTKIKGKKDELVAEYGEVKEHVSTQYHITVRNSGRNDTEAEWVNAEDLFSDYEEARKVIEKRITDEVIEQLSKISTVDLTGGKASE